MKIALLGSAPSSVRLAPFKDSTYHEWVQGKIESMARAHGQVPGDWDIWACSPGCWAVIPRATRFFEVHRWEPGQAWFSQEYCQFLRDFKGPVYTGAPIPEIPNHVVYPVDRIEEKFSSYFLTSSLALMLALAIDEIEQVRARRRRPEATLTTDDADELDNDDIIGMWGVDMAAGEEWGYQRPGCQFFLLEAMRRGIAVFLPPESDLMRPMPVYGISEWDHNYIKLTARAREINTRLQQAQQQAEQARNVILSAQGELNALNAFVNTWTSPYGMPHGITLRHEPGTGLGSGITHLDARPVERMNVGPLERKLDDEIVRAMAQGETSKVSIGDGPIICACGKPLGKPLGGCVYPNCARGISANGPVSAASVPPGQETVTRTDAETPVTPTDGSEPGSIRWTDGVGDAPKSS